MTPRLDRRQFTLGALGLGAAAVTATAVAGGCATPATSLVGASVLRVAEGFLAGVSVAALTEAVEWGEGWARDKLSEAEQRSVDIGYDRSADVRAIVTSRGHAVFARQDEYGFVALGVVPYTEQDDDICFLDSHAYVIAIGEMAEFLHVENPSMTPENIADAVLPLGGFPAIRAAGLGGSTFATWHTEVGAMMTDFDPERGFRCRLLDGNDNIVDHDFTIDDDDDE
jgi:hypothetical protein